MAISTALRFRNRTQSDSAVLLDIIAELGLTEQVIFENVDLSDNVITTYHRRSPGDRVTTFDSDEQREEHRRLISNAIDLVDAVVIEKSSHHVLSDFVQPLDEGFITDKDLLRNRQTSDSINATDNFVKTITFSDFVINSIVLTENIEVNDSVLITVGGIIVRTLSDSIVVSDDENFMNLKIFTDSLNVADDSIELRLIYEVLSDDIVVSDDVLVTRDTIINSVTTSLLSVGVHTSAIDSVNLFDDFQSWQTDILVGLTVKNLTDGSEGIITRNINHQIVAALSGGTDNDWDTDDAYEMAYGKS